MGIGYWGLGIGDWAQSPIPNPQSPIPNPQTKYSILKLNLIYFLKLYFNKNILYNASIKTNIFSFSFLWNMKIIILIF